MALHQFDYIFALGMIFAFLDAWNIGANDVANSFATSVSSRSLKYWQAMVLAAICEFLGAVLLGSRVSDTIRNKILDVTLFEEYPATLMLAMMCAAVGSSIWLTIATRIGAPVSTTHSTVGGIMGVGVATFGRHGVVWGWKGFSQIVASWFIAPAIAGGFGGIIFLIAKFTVLRWKDKALRNSYYLIPFFFCFTTSILTLVIVWKGAPNLNISNLKPGAIAACCLGVAGSTLLIYLLFFFPYFYRKAALEDWTLKPYHMFLGPLLWKRGEVPPPPPGAVSVPDYAEGHKEADDNASGTGDEEKDMGERVITEVSATSAPSENNTPLSGVEKKEIAPWYTPKGAAIRIWKAFTHGLTQDVISYQSSQGGFLAGDHKRRNKNAPIYDNKVEHMFSFLQALTAGTLSFAHGSNDISNAAGPLAAIYFTWSRNSVNAKSPVPVWLLAYTAGALVIGLWTYGYHLMRNLGNRLTLHSPSRGFSMELGAALTTVLATKLGIPISSTQCIIGATVMVGLCNNDLRAVNYRMVAWCYAGWILTVPCAGLISGIICGIIINAPHFMEVYTAS
ncbi:phosphate transporter [Dipodascopsis uninucleata]